MSLIELISKANDKGLLLNNLFQLEKDKWQANFRNDKDGFSFGVGNSPELAVTKAYNNFLLGNGSPLIQNKTKFTVATSNKALSKITLDDL